MKHSSTLRLASLFSAFIACLNIDAQPANDLFANRESLIGTNVTVAGNNWGADTEAGENSGSGNIRHFYSVWYTWTAPANGVVHFSADTEIWSFYPSVRVYRGTEISNLQLIGALPDGGISVTAGDTIQVQLASIYYPVWGGGGGTGPFNLSLWFEVPSPVSPNDAFADRLDITIPAYHFEGSIHGATVEPGEPTSSGLTQTLWWRFVASSDGVFSLWPSAPQFTPVISLYEGSSLETLTPVAALGELRYWLYDGHEYAVQLASGYVPIGAFTLDTHFFSTTNDFFAGSTHLEGTNITFVSDLTTATFEPNEPDPGGTNTIWASWAAPFTGRARFSRTYVSWYQPVAVYTGPTLDHLQPVRIVGMDNGRYDFLAIEGTVYHFQIAGQANDCTLSLQLSSWPQTTNDHFVNAALLKGEVVNSLIDQVRYSIVDATAELGEPAHLGATPFKSLWYRWQAPRHGTMRFYSERSLVTNVVLSVYSGASVEALTLLNQGTNSIAFGVTGGHTYYIAAAVPADAVGDIVLYGQLLGSSASRTVPGNLLREPSWEGTALFGAQYWKMSGSVGGAVGEPGGCDGTTWPALSGPAHLWQDIPTVPGWNYAIRFAIRADNSIVGSGIGDGRVRVLWDNQEVGVGILPEAEAGFWHWAEVTAMAGDPTSRVEFVNLGRNVELDAFSVVALTEPPQIINQPSSASVLDGGTVAFVVGASGSAPLTYQWFRNDAPYAVLDSPVLILDPVSTNHAGTYQAVVANAFGTATSAPVTLDVEAPTRPLIVWQPYGDTVGVGGYHSFSVVAAGTQPLSYQWFKDDSELADATNRILPFASVVFTNAGSYVVRVQNNAGITWSLSANLVVTNSIDGGGQVYFRNRFFYESNIDAPVFDVDGVTGLNGSNFLAQLYGGPALELLRPVSQPSVFYSGFEAGYFRSQIVTLPNVPPGSNAVLQVRAWDSGKGGTYEEARTLGGRFGKSELLNVIAGGGPTPPAILEGLQSFSLQAGLPQFVTGKITLVERQPGGVVVWAHHGEPGFRYVIEKSVHGLEWRPYVVVTNLTSIVTFTDSASSGASVVFYRSRILD